MSYKQASLELYFSNIDSLASNVITIDSDKFYEVLEEFKQAPRFGLDSETFSSKEIDTQGKRFKKVSQAQDIEALDAFLGYIRLIQVGLDSGYALVIDLGGKADKIYPYSLKRLSDFLEVLKDKLYDPNVEVIGHNLLFDLKYLLQHLGFRANKCFDTMLCSQIFWSGVGVAKVGKGESRKNRCKLPHSLIGVCDRLGIEIDKSEQLSDWGWYLTNRQLNYAASDALVVLKVRDILVNKINTLIPDLLYSVNAENLALPVFAEMEYLGFTINESRLIEALGLYQLEINRLTEYWNTISPKVSWTQAKELPNLFREILNIEIESADSATLADYLSLPLIECLLDLRTLNISLNYLNSIKSNAFVGNGRYSVNSHYNNLSIRTKFRQIATNWRSASGKDDDLEKFKAADEINLQQAPKLRKKHESRGLPNVKSVFMPPEGYSLLVADLSQCHARLAAQMSQDATMLSAYNDGLDNHLVMVQRILEEKNIQYTYEKLVELHKSYKGKVKSKVTPTELESEIAETRDHAKTAFYAFLNQSGSYTLQQSFKKDGIILTIDQCQRLIDILREVYKGLYLFIKESMVKANSINIDLSKFGYKDVNGKLLEGNYGIIRGLCGGRNLALKSKQIKDGKVVKTSPEQIAYTDSISFMWLSSEKSMIATVMGRLRLLFQQQLNWEANIINFAHDEMNIICKSDYAIEVANLVGMITKEELSKWITSIPVEEDSNYKSMIVEDWSKK